MIATVSGHSIGMGSLCLAISNLDIIFFAEKPAGKIMSCHCRFRCGRLSSSSSITRLQYVKQVRWNYFVQITICVF